MVELFDTRKSESDHRNNNWQQLLPSVCCAAHIMRCIAVASHYGRPHSEKVCISLLIFYRTEQGNEIYTFHFAYEIESRQFDRAGPG